MVNYQVYGETKGVRTTLAYQTYNYCTRCIEGLTQEEIDEYSVSLGHLFKWLTTTLACRKQDITWRKVLQKQAKEDRLAKIEAEESRKTRREEFLVE